MMSRGVITVYLSLVFMIVLSFLLVLLESARVYTVGTMTERYADMAAEMVFASYVQPMAERYDLLVLDPGENGDVADAFEMYLKMNLEAEQGGSRLMGLNGILQSAQAGSTVSIRDDDWQPLKDQIERYEHYALAGQGVDRLKNLISQLQDTDVKEGIGNYASSLSTQGQAMDQAAAALENSQSPSEQEGTAGEAQITVTDPRPGIGRWLKFGLLNIVMGEQTVSEKRVDTSGCSWQTAENPLQSLTSSFERYKEVARSVKDQGILKEIQDGIQEQGVQLLINVYILDKFHHLCTKAQGTGDDEKTALAYEVEYILYGHETDRENLESAITGIVILRMLLNLVYLYTSQNKTADLNAIVQGMSFLAAIPVAGQVLRLLLMACWAAAEAVVDAASLVEGGKVPLMKSGDTWNLTADQLLRLGEQGGGRASSYVRDGSKGLDYETYLLIFMLLTSPEKKLVRMTQLMECNIRLEEEYEDFSLARCITAAAFSGTVQIGERFFMHPSSMAHEFKVQYGY